jgi:hypothetical protein
MSVDVGAGWQNVEAVLPLIAAVKVLVLIGWISKPRRRFGRPYFRTPYHYFELIDSKGQT